jgi:hypothetical protein
MIPSVGLVDIINEEEELSYIDEDATTETDRTDPRVSAPENNDLIWLKKSTCRKARKQNSPSTWI